MKSAWAFLPGLISAALGVLAVWSTWPDVLRIKGPQWLGETTVAPVLDAGVFLEQHWNSRKELVSYDEVRVRYQFEVDGQVYEYPYNDGYAHVPTQEASADYLEVIYLPSDPSRNHPASMTWVAEDDVFGMMIGVALLQLGLFLFGLPIREIFSEE